MDKTILAISIIALAIVLLFKGISFLIQKKNIYQIRKENEERYRYILENVPDYIWVKLPVYKRSIKRERLSLQHFFLLL